MVRFLAGTLLKVFAALLLATSLFRAGGFIYTSLN